MMEHKERTHPRLKDWDYSQDGAYFITICVKNRSPVLSTVVGRGALTPPLVELSPIGKILDKYILNIEKVYSGVFIDKYVIMPNHVHLLLRLCPYDGGLRAARPTNVETIVRSLKTMVTRETGRSVWQSSFYDHIIRRCVKKMCRWHIFSNRPQELCSEEGN